MNKRVLIWIVICIILGSLCYLCITWFVAHRASHSILDEFIKVNEQLEKTNQSFNKTSFRLSDSSKLYFEKNQPLVLKDFNKTTASYDSLFNYMENLKQIIITETEEKKDSIPPDYYLNENELVTLKEKIKRYIDLQNKLRTSLELKTTYTSFTDSVTDEQGIKISWEMFNFYHLPLAGVITNLSQMQSDMRKILIDLKNDLELYSKAKKI